MSEARYTIYICGNAEVICDGHTDDRTDAWEAEIARAFADAASRVISDYCVMPSGEIDWKVDSYYQHWRGGRHSGAGKLVGSEPWGYSAGLVVVHEREIPDWLRELCDRAMAAGEAAREEEISRLEALSEAASKMEA